MEGCIQAQQIDLRCYPEFSAELVLAVPYAYHLHRKGLLGTTTSVKDTKPLYFFSRDHIEQFEFRSISNEEALQGYPNNWIHHNPLVSNGRAGILDFSEWEMPPFKEYYKNDIFRYDKPLLIISNKYFLEWGDVPVNYLDIETLYYLFDYLKDKYHVVYKRPKGTEYVPDQNEFLSNGSDIMAEVNGEPMSDYELCRRMDITIFQDLWKESSFSSFNLFQFKLFANCDNYISVQGGNSHICSLFGKTNVCYIKEGRELREGYFDKEGWYYKMNQCNTIPVRTYKELLDKVKELY